MMNNQLDYVFKLSLKMAKVAILMDQTSSTNIALQEEAATLMEHIQE